MQHTLRNVEDWDFRGAVEEDLEADLFLSTHYTYVVAADSWRLTIIHVLVERGLMTLSADGEYVVPVTDSEFWNSLAQGYQGDREREPTPQPDSTYAWFDRDTKSPLIEKLSRTGRFMCRVRRSLWREWQKYGRIKVRLMQNEAEREESRRRIRDDAAVYDEWNVDESD